MSLNWSVISFNTLIIILAGVECVAVVIIAVVTTSLLN